jgi:hypothetical protein
MTDIQQVHLICTDDSCGAEYILLKKFSCATSNPLCVCGSELKTVLHVPIFFYQAGSQQPSYRSVFKDICNISKN